MLSQLITASIILQINYYFVEFTISFVIATKLTNVPDTSATKSSHNPYTRHCIRTLKQRWHPSLIHVNSYQITNNSLQNLNLTQLYSKHQIIPSIPIFHHHKIVQRTLTVPQNLHDSYLNISHTSRIFTILSTVLKRLINNSK